MTTQPRLAPHPARMDVDEYLAWADDHSDERSELVNGQVVAMVNESLGHARTKLRAAAALQRAVDARGLGCEAFGDGIGVRVADDTLYGPDATVRCGARLPDDDRIVTDPIILVEVLSPSSGRVDTGRKLKGYFTLPSLRHYLVLDPVDRSVVHHRRAAEGGPIETHILPPRAADEDAAGAADLLLDPPGLRIPVADLFAAP